MKTKIPAQFKIGQKLRCVERRDHPLDYMFLHDDGGGCGWRKNNIITVKNITHIGRNDMYPIYWTDDDSRGGIYENFLEAVNEEWNEENND